MIDIIDTEGFNEKEFSLLIADKLKNSGRIEINVPKYTKQFFSTVENIAEDYLTLSTIGHILNKASANFSYEKISPTINQSVKSTITPKNKGKINKVLQEVSFLYTDNIENLDREEYDKLFISEFLDFAKNNKVAYPYFYETYLRFEPKIID